MFCSTPLKAVSKPTNGGVQRGRSPLLRECMDRDTWWTHLSMLGIVPEVKLGDLMSGEEDVPDSIVSCRTNSHWHALEGLRYL